MIAVPWCYLISIDASVLPVLNCFYYRRCIKIEGQFKSLDEDAIADKDKKFFSTSLRNLMRKYPQN